MLLDRDYYPDEYLKKVRKELKKVGIRLVLTPGKEIQNTFLTPSTIKAIIPEEKQEDWQETWERVFQNEYNNCLGSFLKLHEEFCNSHKDAKTVMTEFKPKFDKNWKDPQKRYLYIDGKKALGYLRKFYRDHTKENLNQQILVEATVRTNRRRVESFVKKVFAS